ncbi:hypothetical protein HK104_010323 [Borealophlyctis nickersoniae]|nr:hypothetical protein HK104_010323 [Borealophlyctis nickersoniae]
MSAARLPEGSYNVRYLNTLHARICDAMKMNSIIVQAREPLPDHMFRISAELSDRLSEWKQRTNYVYNDDPNYDPDLMMTHLKPIQPTEVALASVIAALGFELSLCVHIHYNMPLPWEKSPPPGARNPNPPSPDAHKPDSPFLLTLSSAFRKCFGRVDRTSRHPNPTTVSNAPARMDVPPAYVP